PNTLAARLGQAMNTKTPVSWLVGNPLKLLDEVSGTFDCIVSNPPFGLKSDALSLTTNHRDVDLRDSLGHRVLAVASVKLSDVGVMAFVAAPAFLASSTPRGFRAQFAKLNLHLLSV